jgi:hypothetical protein
MLRYALIVGALFLGCLGASEAGLYFLGAALFPIPIAVYLGRRNAGRAVGLLACAALAEWIGSGTVIETVFYTLLAGAGIPLGLGIALRWTYGWTVAVVAGFLYAVIAVAFISVWPEWVAQSQAAWDVLLHELRDATTDSEGESAAAMARMVVWMKEHWAAVGLGLWLWPVVIAACSGVSVVSGWLRRRWNTAGLRGSFREMRTSEWLVWTTILVALMCFADQRWPELGLRVISWNSAVALAAIYWLNGLSIFVFTLDALRTHFLLVATMVLLFVWAMPHPLLCAIGLFDTWADFRGRLHKAIAARKHREQSDDLK